MFNKIKKGMGRGILVAFLTSIILPLLSEGFNIVLQLLASNPKIYLTFLSLPDVYIGYSILAFFAYLVPCIFMGIVLQISTIKKIVKKLLFVLIFVIGSYFIIQNYLFISTSPIYYPLIIMSMLATSQYICFFIWLHTDD